MLEYYIMVKCDKCGQIDYFPVKSRKALLQLESYHRGWIYRNGKDICTECERKREDVE